MDQRESDISGDGDVFDGERAIGRAHVDICVPPAAVATSERHKDERSEKDGRMGMIWFQGQTPLGPPFALIGKELKMRLDGGRSLDFMLCDSGNIHALRITGPMATCPRCGGCFSEHHRCFGTIRTVGVVCLGGVLGWLFPFVLSKQPSSGLVVVSAVLGAVLWSDFWEALRR